MGFPFSPHPLQHSLFVDFFFLVLSLALFKEEIKECLSPKTLMAEGDVSSLNRYDPRGGGSERLR